MQYIKRQLSFFFSSDTNSGAYSISPLGNRFSVSLPRPLMIPKNSVACEIGLLSASVWNVSPNIAALYGNNVFSFTTGGITYNYTIPDGLYSLTDLASYLSIQFVNNALAPGLFTFAGNNSTQQVIITYLNAGDSINWNVANNVAPILGFGGSGVITAPSANWSSFSPSQATFNRVNSYIVTGDIVSQGIPINSTSAQVLGRIPISAAPGSQINLQNQIISWCDASELIGSNRVNFTFSLLDQSLRDVSTNGEDWEIVIIVKFSMPSNPML